MSIGRARVELPRRAAAARAGEARQRTAGRSGRHRNAGELRAFTRAHATVAGHAVQIPWAIVTDAGPERTHARALGDVDARTLRLAHAAATDRGMRGGAERAGR